jgi:hypothetical protein
MDDRLMNRTVRFVTAFLTFPKARTSISRPAHAWRDSLSLIGLPASQRASKIVDRACPACQMGGNYPRLSGWVEENIEEMLTYLLPPLAHRGQLPGVRLARINTAEAFC